MSLIYYDRVFDNLKNLKYICKTRDWAPNEKHVDRTSCALRPSERLDPHEIYKVYTEFIGEYHTFKLDPSYVDCKLAQYVPGQEMGWHDDYGLPVKYTNQKNPGGRRQITSITYINDDYEGGETEFRDGTLITPKAGYTLIFPSHWSFRHRGREVTKGVKWIFIEHLWG